MVYTPAASGDDAEEATSGTIGTMDLSSSDLELMKDGSKDQIIGIRFRNITIPQGATIQSAYIQFATKGDKAPVAGDITIQAQDADNAAIFTSTLSSISSRTKTSASVTWTGSTSTTWGTTAAGTAGADQRTPDVSSLVSAVISRTGWASGNALAFILSGTGTRNAYSYDGSGGDYSNMPKLIVKYTYSGLTTLAAASLPIEKYSQWLYLDNGTDQGTGWNSPSFDDSGWSYGTAKLGYEDGATTTLSYGADANNKFITTYFRKKFTISDVISLTDSLKISLLSDDGAMVYINGTEVVRRNIPAGLVNYLTTATSTIDGTNESTYFDYKFSKNLLLSGTNTIAVELHQQSATSSDIGFDLALSEVAPTAVAANCDPLSSTHISNYVSVLPSTQPDSLRIPSTHTFQMLLQTGDAYTNAADGSVKSTFDFTGYVPISGSSTNGYLSVNHEGGTVSTAGVSILDLNYNSTSKLWQVSAKAPVNFAPVQGTVRNCSGTVTPWNTIITSEESVPTGDANSDGYDDIGWNVEINPVTRAVVDNDGDGNPDKLWKLGKMSHENVVVAADRKTVYEGNDESPGYIFKFVADVAQKLGAGKLYVLKLDGTLDNAVSGTWLQVPNSTPAECNNVRSYANSVGATNFVQIEDVEINPVDSLVYFTSKNSGRVYRFKDLGTSGVNNYSIFVGNTASVYPITYNGGATDEQWRGGNDNLTFDDKGNLYVLQDGDRNHIWMVRPCHTQASPKVELFAVTPAGCEPTGMTFSPDYKFMFVSIQEPDANTKLMKDAAGNQVAFNKSSTIVIARKEDLGLPTTLPITLVSFNAKKVADSQVELKWKYITDESHVKFEVQRMVFGGGFQTIETISRPATPNTQSTFVYIDRSPYYGDNLYRIKSIDANGKESFSVIELVNVPQLASKQGLSVYPNPANTTINVLLSVDEPSKANLKIVDNSGKVIKYEQIQLSKGANNLSYDVHSLVSGVYHIIVSTLTQSYSTTFIKN